MAEDVSKALSRLRHAEDSAKWATQFGSDWVSAWQACSRAKCAIFLAQAAGVGEDELLAALTAAALTSSRGPNAEEGVDYTAEEEEAAAMGALKRHLTHLFRRKS